jgi:TolA-binding protein
VLALPALVSHPTLAETKPAAKELQDDAIEALARKAMAMEDPALQKEALRTLRAHRFRSTRAPQREFVLFAQGILEDRHEDVIKASETMRKLEKTWPKSVYLPEAQTILGQEAVERRRFKDAETRLRKALSADIAVEGKRRTQELLLWVFVEQAKPEKGLPIIESLYPLGTAKPSEKGLVAMTEVLAVAQRKDEAEATRKDFHELYPKSPFGPRVDLACGRMLGALGEAKASAEILRRIILEAPDTPEADEARLALASLLSEGKLTPRQAKAYPDPDKLLSEIRKADGKGDLGRRALLVRFRMQVKASQWREAVDTATQIRAKDPSEDETTEVTTLRADAFRAWAQELLDLQQIDPLLGYLDREGIQSLRAEQRNLLAQRLAQSGLSTAALTVAELAPVAERSFLQRSILERTQAEVHPAEALRAMPDRGESGAETLKRAQAALALQDWKAARNALGKAKPGAERILAITVFLRRPAESTEGNAGRLRDAENWLARGSEKGVEREPLVLLVADLRAKAGDWRGALSLYPTQPSKEQRGWVALLRATCQQKLGQRGAAKATLKQAVDEPGFRMERENLARQLEK